MILAPMQGLTEVLFRRVYEECFPGAIQLAVSPFIALTRNLRFSTDNAQIRDVMPENNRNSMPVIPQILGKEPDEFVLLAKGLSDMGYTEVNWNMGCPMRAITAKHRGCGLMPHPDEVRAILDSVMPRLPLRLSVKVRLGLKDKEDIFQMVPVLNDYPLASVTIHPRLGRQQYTGHPDLDTFGQVLPLVVHPVIYNGDICTAADAWHIRERFPQVNDIMVGRGILYRPTLPMEIREWNAQKVDEKKLLDATDALQTASNPQTSDARRLDEKKAIEMNKKFVTRLMEEITLQMPSDESRIRKKKEYWSLMWRSLPISEIQAREVLRAQELTVVDNLIEQLTQ